MGDTVRSFHRVKGAGKGKEKGEIHTELYFFYIEFLQYISLHLHILSTT